MLARDEGWICVTNDSRLRKECSAEGIEVLWGLELMVKLVKMGQLTPAAATTIARKIHMSNPRHITPQIIRRFERTVLTARIKKR